MEMPEHIAFASFDPNAKEIFAIRVRVAKSSKHLAHEYWHVGPRSSFLYTTQIRKRAEWEAEGVVRVLAHYGKSATATVVELITKEVNDVSHH